ncbi:NB-ARC domain-containing protein [Actinomadura rubteroloni]|nr:NB-ARC domain-containing protein [Actinomadura rubteroloni]
MRDLHQHFAPPAPVIVPRQLPSGPAWFVNRVAELAELDAVLADASQRVRLVVVSGLGGVGKTGLGLYWAHRVAAAFPDGQLYADLAAFARGGGTDIDDVLSGFLRAFSVRDEWIPDAFAEKRALFRSLVADRRVLIVLDDVADAAQVRALLPGSSDCVVLVTSRHRLTGLVVDGAVPLRLEPLEAARGVELLGRMLSDARVDEEREAAAEIVRQVGGLPLALRVCGARLAQRRRGLGRLAAALTDERRRLSQLSAEGKPVVEAVFDAAYAGLDPRAAALYRGLGAHPGPEFPLDVLTVVTGGTPDDAADVADVLVEANLLEVLGEDRYRFHALVRLHAEALADAGRARPIIAWYLGRARAADHAVLGRRLRLFEEPVEQVFASRRDALAWLERERANLVAAVRAAALLSWDSTVCQFVEALWAFYNDRFHHADEIEVARLGVQAAVRLGDLPFEARARNQLIRARLRAGEDVAAADVRAAYDVARRSGHRRVESAVLETVGLAHRARGDHDAALGAFEEAREINAEQDNPRGIGLQLLHAGIELRLAGRAGASAERLGEALRVMTEIGDELSQGKVRMELGEALIVLGRLPEARAELARALDVMTDGGLPDRQVRALELLARASTDPAEAERFRRAAEVARA